MRSDQWKSDRVLDPALIAGARLVSLDIFDTLLLRRCGFPEDLFPTLAQGLAAPGVSEEDVAWFPLLRREAEAAARRSAASEGRGEISLDDIYQVLPRRFGSVEELCGREFQAELEATVANPLLVSLLDALKEQNTPVVLVSDMYLGAARIERLLAKAGIDRSQYSDLIVSSDFGSTKSGGGLFKVLLDRYPELSSPEFLHIGDNPHSDVAMPRSLGMQAIHYQPDDRFRDIIDREETIGVRATGHLHVTRSIAAHLRPPVPEDGFWFDFGLQVVGPAVDAFARWVVADCVARGITRIAPFMREGAIFAKAMCRHAEALDVDLDIRPVYVSRQALYLPTLQKLTREHIQAFIASTPVRKLGDLMRAHETAIPASLAPYEDVYLGDLGGRRDATGSDILNAAIEHILSEANRERIEASAARHRAFLMRYLDEELGNAECVATVDFGARASAQAALYALPEIRARWNLAGYLFYGAPALAGRMLSGMQVRVYAPADGDSLLKAQTIQRSPQFLELLLNGNAPTAIGYQPDAQGNVLPELAPAVQDADQRRALDAAQAGILAYIEMSARLLPLKTGRTAQLFDRKTVFDIVVRPVQVPTLEEARQFGALQFDYNDFHDGHRRLVDDTAVEAITLKSEITFPYVLKSLMLTQPTVIPWPQGALTAINPHHIYALHDGARQGIGHQFFCRLLIKKILDAGVTSLVAFAAGGEGGMGPTFLRLARNADLNMVGYVDYFPDRVGGAFRAVPVLTPDDLAELPAETAIAVISTGYGAKIVTILEAVTAKTGKRFEIFRLDS